MVTHAGAADVPCRRGRRAVPAWQMVLPVPRTVSRHLKTVTSHTFSAACGSVGNELGADVGWRFVGGAGSG